MSNGHCVISTPPHTITTIIINKQHSTHVSYLTMMRFIAHFTISSFHFYSVPFWPIWCFCHCSFTHTHLDIYLFILTFCSSFFYSSCGFEFILQSQRYAPLILGVLLQTLSFLPATNLFVTVGFVVAERVLYIPRYKYKYIHKYRPKHIIGL